METQLSRGIVKKSVKKFKTYVQDTIKTVSDQQPSDKKIEKFLQELVYIGLDDAESQRMQGILKKFVKEFKKNVKDAINRYSDKQPSDRKLKKILQKIVADIVCIRLEKSKLKRILHVTNTDSVKNSKDGEALIKLLHEHYFSKSIDVKDFMDKLTNGCDFNSERATDIRDTQAEKLKWEMKAAEPSGIPSECPLCGQVSAYSTIKMGSAPGSCGGKAIQNIFTECRNCGVLKM